MSRNRILVVRVSGKGRLYGTGMDTGRFLGAMTASPTHAAHRRTAQAKGDWEDA